MIQAFENAGITDELLVKKHKEHLNARKYEDKDYYIWSHEDYDDDPVEIEEEIQADIDDRIP